MPLFSSLKTKVSVFVTILIFIIGTTTTIYLISFNKKAIEDALISKGKAISESISLVAEKGLVEENLDIMDIASSLLKDDEIIRIEIFNNLWDSIAHYSRTDKKENISMAAIKHFENSDELFYIKYGDMYDFYIPIKFQPIFGSNPIIIGYSKLCLTTLPIKKKIDDSIRKIFLTGISLTILTIIFINMFMDRILIRPLSALYRNIRFFKEGIKSKDNFIYSKDEIGELAKEFESMSESIRLKTESLIESEKRIRNLFERTDHALFRLDKECNIIETSKKFDEIFGTVKKFCDILADEEIKRCIDMAISETLVYKEEKVIDKNGNTLTVLLSLYVERDQNNEIIGFDGYITDITEKKKLEEQLIQSQKMEAIGFLAGGIAHDFNNLLQGIIGYSSLLKMKIPEEDPNYKAINIIEQSALKASDLTKQLLGFARGGKYMAEPINLNEAINNVLAIIKRTFDKKIEITIDLLKDLWIVEADQSQIEQVILNMCINAKDAMPEGGILSIKTWNYDYKPNISTTLIPFDAKEGRYVAISISDTGIGIPVEIQKRIFEPFFTTKEKGKGTGMGLAMAYGVIKNHKGYITVESEVKKGTTFTIYLPAIESTGTIQKEIKVEDSNRPSKIFGRGMILLIDDEEIVRSVAKDLLENLGYEVLEARDGLEAIDIFKKKNSDIDLVILDLIMPRVSGKETFYQLKEINPNVKVLVSSGYSIDSDAKELINSGAIGFIQKPYKIKELEEVLKTL